MEVLKWVVAGICKAALLTRLHHDRSAQAAHAHGLFLSLAGSLHRITLFSLSILLFSVIIAFLGIFLGKLRIAHRYKVSCQLALHTAAASGSKDITLRCPGRGTRNTRRQEGWTFSLAQGLRAQWAHMPSIQRHCSPPPSPQHHMSQVQSL